MGEFKIMKNKNVHVLYIKMTVACNHAMEQM